MFASRFALNAFYAKSSNGRREAATAATATGGERQSACARQLHNSYLLIYHGVERRRTGPADAERAVQRRPKVMHDESE